MALLPPQTFTPSAVYGLPFTPHRQRQDVPAQRAARPPADAMGQLLDLYRDGQTGSDAPAPARQRAAGDVSTVWRLGRRHDGRPSWDCVGTYATSAATATANQLAAANPGVRFVAHRGYDEPADTAAAVKPAPAPAVHRPAPVVAPAAAEPIPRPDMAGVIDPGTVWHESGHATAAALLCARGGFYPRYAIIHPIGTAAARGETHFDFGEGRTDWSAFAVVVAAGAVAERIGGFTPDGDGADRARLAKLAPEIARAGRAGADFHAEAAALFAPPGCRRALAAVADVLRRDRFIDGAGVTAVFSRVMAGGV